jgi:membrane-bound metal-dependent hydrolase YbcI (DUF457 family)
MPSPIGHALGGLLVHAVSAGRAELWNRKRASLLGGLGAAPDLDLLLRYLDGSHHHRAEGHSLGAAIAVGVGTWLAARLGRSARPTALGVAAGCAWLTHVVLDVLGSDSNPPYGVMALWPFSRRYFISPIPLFPDIGRTLTLATVWQNAAAAAWETAVLFPILLAVVCWRERRS